MPKNKLLFSFLISATFLFLSIIFLRAKVNAAWYVDGYGNLIYEEDGQVLGVVFAKGDDNGDDSGGSSGSGSSGSGSSDSDSSGSGSSTNTTTTIRTQSTTSSSSVSGPTGVTSLAGEEDDEDEDDLDDVDDRDDDDDELDDENRQEATGAVRIKSEDGKTEIIFAEGEKIKVRTENGETRTDIVSGGVKVRFELKDGRLVIKAENETGEDITLGKQDLFKIEERLDKNIVKVATGSGNTFVFARGGFAAQTTFPLSVDLATNALTIETPAGVKTVTILPDSAVGNMLAANVIDKLGPQAVAEAARLSKLSGISGLVQLGLKNGVPVYEIVGLSNQKLLGFIPVAIEKTVVVSAETGELVTTQKNLPNILLDAISL